MECIYSALCNGKKSSVCSVSPESCNNYKFLDAELDAYLIRREAPESALQGLEAVA